MIIKGIATIYYIINELYFRVGIRLVMLAHQLPSEMSVEIYRIVVLHWNKMVKTRHTSDHEDVGCEQFITISTRRTRSAEQFEAQINVSYGDKRDHLSVYSYYRPGYFHWQFTSQLIVWVITYTSLLIYYYCNFYV